MTDKVQIQTYVNNFRRRITPFLRPGMGLQCRVFPASSGGALLVFHVGPNVENDDLYETQSSTLGQAISRIEQHAFGGNLEAFTFSGTNLILERDRIILIKDASPIEWTDAAAEKDVQRVLNPRRRGQK